MTNEIRVKWAGSNTVLVKGPNDQRLVIHKKELLSLRDEIDEFISYYSSNFVEPVLSYEDSLGIDNDDINPKWVL